MKIRNIAVLLLIVTSTLSASQKEDFLKKEKAIKTKKACDFNGGQWGVRGLWKIPFCNLPTPDKGKECTDSSECVSSCVADIPMEKFNKKGKCTGPAFKDKPCTSVIDCGGKEVCEIYFEPISGQGKCYGWTSLLGTCLNYVKRGMIDSPLCID